MGIFFAEYGLGGVEMPVDIQCGIGNGYAAVGLGRIVIVAFVLENGLVGKHCKTVGKTTGDEELTVVVFGQLDCDMTAIGRRAYADIDCHVKHASADTSYEFGLSVRGTLEMQSAHHAAG